MPLSKHKLMAADLYEPMRATGAGVWQLSITNNWRSLTINQEFLQLLGYNQLSFPTDYQQIKKKLFQPQDSIIFEMDIEDYLRHGKNPFCGTYRLWNQGQQQWQRVRMAAARLTPHRPRHNETLLSGMLQNLDFNEYAADNSLWQPAEGVELSPELQSLVSEILEASDGPSLDAAATLELPTASQLQEIISLNCGSAQSLQSLMDSVPLPCIFTNKDFEYIGCNDAAVQLFGCSDKSDFSRKFEGFFPPLQPDGKDSLTMREKHLENAFKHGKSVFEWTYQLSNGDLIPAEVTLVRLDSANEYITMAYIKDLRELKEKDKAINRERELLQTTLDSSPVCFVILVNGVVRFATNYTNFILGAQVGDRLTDFYIDQDSREQFLADLGREGIINWRLVTLKGAQGQSLDMLTNAFVAEYYGEHCIMAWFLDVTEIRVADERMRIMLDSMPLCCIFWDENLKSLDCNQAVVKLFGLESKQQFMDNFFDFSPPLQPNGRSTQEAWHALMEQAFLGGHYQFEWMHQKKGGEPLPTEITLTRVLHGDKFIVLAYLRDLRELKAKEAALDKERVLLKTVLDSSPVCFIIWVDGVVRFAAPYAQDFFGAQIGDPSLRYYITQQEHDDFFHNIMALGSINWQVVSMRASDGTIKDMLANAFQAEYYGEQCVMSWFLDITDIREKERQLSLARDAAEESTKAKGYFLANMSHEIRTPMNAILGMTQLVLGSEGLNAHQRDYLEKAEHSAKALLRILNDILDFSKIEAGKMEIEMVDFALDALLQDLFKVMETKADNKGVLLRLNIAQDVPLRLVGDPLRLNQVLLNLTDNAIKFTEKGLVTIQVECERQSQDEAILRFCVSDSGIGLTSSQLERLFSPFTQADSSTTRRHGGTGLGLAICKTLVEMMGGQIWATSQAGQGASFYFTTTHAISHKPGQKADAGQHQWENARFEKTNIMVAEDNLLNQVVAKKMLENLGCQVSVASNGKQAVDMALRGDFDLIFMDIQMPEMDGLTATERLREYGHLENLPIVAMTAHAMVGDKEKSLAAGMNDHLTKPIDKRELIAILNRWLNN